MTHLRALQISMKFLPTGGSDIRAVGAVVLIKAEFEPLLLWWWKEGPDLFPRMPVPPVWSYRKGTVSNIAALHRCKIMYPVGCLVFLHDMAYVWKFVLKPSQNVPRDLSHSNECNWLIIDHPVNTGYIIHCKALWSISILEKPSTWTSYDISRRILRKF